MTSIPTATAALLVMDVQKNILPMMVPDPDPLLERMARVIAAARAASVPVIYVVVGFRPGYPDLNPRNERMSAIIVGRGGFELEDPRAILCSAVAPEDGDVVVTKRRVSAFSGSDLEIVLRSGGIDTLVMMGVATSGVVLSTTRQAFDADYRLAVVSDGCVDPDPEVHRLLCDKVLARQATIVTADELVASWA